MSTLRIVSFHEHKCLPWVQQGLIYYADKMKYWVQVESVFLKPTGGSDRRVAQQKDWQKYHTHSALSVGSRIILDEKGQEYRSLLWGQKVPQWMERKGGVSFLIGPSYGLDSKWSDESLATLSLSTMTMPHELALVVLMEQIYRSLTIYHKIPYHCE